MTGETTSTADGQTAEQVQPFPPRYWWLKRIALGICVLLTLLIALRLWWGHVADARLQTEIDRLLALGEPIFPDDFNPKEPIPEERNAATLCNKATQALSLNVDDRAFVAETWSEPNWTEDQLARITRIVEANEEAFALIRTARDLPDTDWGTRFSSPAITVFWTANFSDRRFLAKLLSLRAQLQSKKGSHADAVETLLDSLGLGEANGRDPGLIPSLVSMAILTSAYSRIESVLPRLRIRRDGDNDNDNQSVDRRRLEELLTRLTNERSLHTSIQRGLKCEKMFMFDIARNAMVHGANVDEVYGATGPLTSTWWDRLVAWPLRPTYAVDTVRSLNIVSAILQSASAPNWPAAQKAYPNTDSSDQWMDDVIYPLSFGSADSLQRFVFLHFRALASRRLAATAVAIRIYEFDHGRRPATLDELVPDYLAAVPLDTMAGGDMPIGYFPHAQRPILYSVDENGIDDGGKYEIDERGYVNRRAYDWPFFLDGPPPRIVEPAETPADDRDSIAKDAAGERP